MLRGSEMWADGFSTSGVVPVHQGHQGEVEITGEDSATAIWAMADRLFMPPGAPFSLLTGYGHHHETYERQDGVWKIKTLRLARLRVEVTPAPAASPA